MSTARPPASAGLQDDVSKDTRHKRRQLSLANISIPFQSLGILRRKPLPANSPIRQQRSVSLESPKPSFVQKPLSSTLTPIASPGQSSFVVRDLDQDPHGHTPVVQPAEPTPTSLSSQNLISPGPPLGSPRKSRYHNRNSSAPVLRAKPRHDRNTSTRSVKTFLADPSEEEDTTISTPRTRRHKAMPASISHGQTLRIRTNPSYDDDVDSMSPRSPAPRKLSNFFGWTKSPGGPESPSTPFSGISPVSPMPGNSSKNGYFGGKLAPTALDIPKANAQSSYFMPMTPGLPSPPISSTHAADLEQELRELSTELANSLRREMELEDDLERARAEPNHTSLEAGRRTSDYFSDSGAGSVRYPDSEGKIEQLERLRRAAEQGKAQLKVQMSQRIQDALQQRQEAEEKTIHLHERLKSVGLDTMDGHDPRELKVSLSETKRKLSEESALRKNLQDLVGGMRVELEQIKNERDNLRDEVVPQMRARLEGLEQAAATNQSMTYEHTRLSQEVQTLRTQLEMHQQGSRFVSIDEERSPSTPSSPSIGGLSRSKSFAVRGRGSRSNSITRSASIKENKTYESKEVLAQKVKDIETQRDALHKALRSLLDRHHVEEKSHAKKLKQLEKELAHAQTLTPRRTLFHEEVKHLKDEVYTLRGRADEALDQKWQCEKNLSGVKMDLDRAQQESSSLRNLLDRRDMFMPDRPGSRDGTKALDKAYKELRTTHALSIAHLKEMEAGEASLGYSNAEAERTLELLKQSISDAETERDIAQSQAAEHRQQARNLQASELDHLSKEQSLSAELYASAQRMDDLANQVQTQIQSNSVLRQKLAEAFERSEREQTNSSTKISQMQAKLRDLEDRLMAAQSQSEDIMNTHEQEVKELKDAHNDQLQRTKSSTLLTPSQYADGSNSGTSTSLFALKTPQINRVSLADATKTGALESRVRELERALNDADQEMGEVVSRMNKAQMEVADLQSERDEAMMATRRLQAEYLKEREMVQRLMQLGTSAPQNV